MEHYSTPAEREQLKRDALILANARRIMKATRTPNQWLVAELFGQGSTSAHEICLRLGLDPEGRETRYDLMIDYIKTHRETPVFNLTEIAYNTIMDEWFKAREYPPEYCLNDAESDIIRMIRDINKNNWQPMHTCPIDEWVIFGTYFDGPNDWRMKQGFICKERKTPIVSGGSWKPVAWHRMPEGRWEV